MIRGVETSTSTPHASSNIHSFFGLFTRATTRGTANSVFARSETTRLALSSPVAATTTSHSSIPAWMSEDGSHASARCHSASATEATFMAEGCRSRRATWWPWPRSSRAIDRPTLPAPAMTTRISALPCRGFGQDPLDRPDLVRADHHVHHVVLLEHRVGGGKHPLA